MNTHIGRSRARRASHDAKPCVWLRADDDVSRDGSVADVDVAALCGRPTLQVRFSFFLAWSFLSGLSCRLCTEYSPLTVTQTPATRPKVSPQRERDPRGPAPRRSSLIVRLHGRTGLIPGAWPWQLKLYNNFWSADSVNVDTPLPNGLERRGCSCF